MSGQNSAANQAIIDGGPLQFVGSGGHSTTGALDPDPQRRWRCLRVDHIDAIAAADPDSAWTSADSYNPTSYPGNSASWAAVRSGLDGFSTRGCIAISSHRCRSRGPDLSPPPQLQLPSGARHPWKTDTHHTRPFHSELGFLT